MAGYNGYSMSNNARDAYSVGKVPKSKITKALLNELGIPLKVKEIKQLIDDNVLEPCEWHHTSKRYNETSFYDLQEIVDWFVDEEEELVNTELQSRIEAMFKMNEYRLLAVAVAPTLIENSQLLLPPPPKEFSEKAESERQLANLQKYGMSRNQWEKMCRRERNKS